VFITVTAISMMMVGVEKKIYAQADAKNPVPKAKFSSGSNRVEDNIKQLIHETTDQYAKEHGGIEVCIENEEELIKKIKKDNREL